MSEKEKTGAGGGLELSVLLKGIWVGGTMMVPGISGGSMAMLLGIYDRLLWAVGSFWKKPKENALFLGCFLAGGVCGLLAFARGLELLLNSAWSRPLRCFFLGAVAGGIPAILRKTEVRRPSWKVLLCPTAGIVLVQLLSRLPQGFFCLEAGSGPAGIVQQATGGVILAVGLVLPGVSVSQLLYMLGIYEAVLEKVASLELLSLLPMGAGGAAGMILTARGLESLLRCWPKQVYLLIFGFVLGSVPELIAGLWPAVPWPACLIGTALGFGVMAVMSWEE